MDYLYQNFSVKSPSEVTWCHGVNSKSKLKESLENSSCMMVEVDILVSQSGVPIAAHSPDAESDLTFDDLLSHMSKSKQRLKLDFKDPEIVTICLTKLKKFRLPQPILLNADVLQGNEASPPKFSPVEFLDICKKYYPDGVLSLGWTTNSKSTLGYTRQNVEGMLRVSNDLKEVTYPIRACLLETSWKNLKRLIKKDGHSITIWNNEPVDDNLQKWIKNNTDPNKTFYDIISYAQI